MTQQDGLRLFALCERLQELKEEGLRLIPSYVMIKNREFDLLVDSLPAAIDDNLKTAQRILRNKEEIIQEARVKADRIIQDAENERIRILDESSLRREMEEQAKTFREKVIQECENIKIKAFSEAEEIRIASNEDALKMKDGAQAYAQQILVKLEQDLNSLFQVVKNGQQYIEQLRNLNEENEAQLTKDAQKSA